MTDGAKDQDGQQELDAATVQLVLKETKDLIRSLEGTATSRVKVQAGTLQIEVERELGVMTGGTMAPMSAPTTSMPSEAPSVAPGVLPVVAPLVGVFYRAPAPDAKPFVEVGDTVEPGQAVGIVEAMKVMNQVSSDHHGVVKEILVENGETVQYEQPLMLIDTTATEQTG